MYTLTIPILVTLFILKLTTSIDLDWFVIILVFGCVVFDFTIGVLIKVIKEMRKPPEAL